MHSCILHTSASLTRKTLKHVRVIRSVNTLDPQPAEQAHRPPSTGVLTAALVVFQLHCHECQHLTCWLRSDGSHVALGFLEQCTDVGVNLPGPPLRLAAVSSHYQTFSLGVSRVMGSNSCFSKITADVSPPQTAFREVLTQLPVIFDCTFYSPS